MSTAEETTTQFEIIDHNITPEYVTYIVDLWVGNRHDPAVGIMRHIGVWHSEDLETEERGAFDPDFAAVHPNRYRSQPKPEPLLWDTLEEVKAAEKDAERFKNEQNAALNTEGYSYNRDKTHDGLYARFLDAVDVLAADGENVEAWLAVDQFRDYSAKKHES